MKRKNLIAIFLIIFLLYTCSCSTINNISSRDKMTYTYSFENISEFDGNYIVPQNHLNSSSHSLSTEQVHSGTYSHKAWIYAANSPSTIFTNNNHRAYPAIQFYKSETGSVITPCFITLYVWLDIDLQTRSPENEWFSFATLCTDDTDDWNRVIVVNLSNENIVHIMHAPYQGSKEWIFQTTDIKFPMREWVKLTIYIDTVPNKGYIKVYQNDVLVSQANIYDGDGTIDQMHFGMYAAPSITEGVVYNDDLKIEEVEGE